MARPVTYGRRMRIYITPEHMEQIERDRALYGGSISAAVRRALDIAYPTAPAPTKKPRTS